MGRWQRSQTGRFFVWRWCSWRATHLCHDFISSPLCLPRPIWALVNGEPEHRTNTEPLAIDNQRWYRMPDKQSAISDGVSRIHKVNRAAERLKSPVQVPTPHTVCGSEKILFFLFSVPLYASTHTHLHPPPLIPLFLLEDNTIRICPSHSAAALPVMSDLFCCIVALSQQLALLLRAVEPIPLPRLVDSICIPTEPPVETLKRMSRQT
jgi:hypothetical protein